MLIESKIRRHIPFIIVAIEQKTPRSSSKNTIVIEHLQNGLTFAAMMTEERAVPANTIETGTEIFPPAADASDVDTLLSDQFRRCHRATAKCFEFADEEGMYFSAQMEAFKIAAKLMKSSLDLARVLRSGDGGEVRHRFIYERTSSLQKNRQTNSGIEAGEAHDG